MSNLRDCGKEIGRTWKPWAELLNARGAWFEPCYETTVRWTRYQEDGAISILYHTTPIVTLYEDGRIKLNTGGYKTPTTKTRLNWFAPVYQERGDWFVRWPVEDLTIEATGEVVKATLHPFESGMTLYPDGRVDLPSLRDLPGGGKVVELEEDPRFSAWVDAGRLVRTIERVAQAASFDDDTRRHLRCICLRVGAGVAGFTPPSLRLVAADGYTLTKVDWDLPDACGLREGSALIDAAEALAAVKKLNQKQRVLIQIVGGKLSLWHGCDEVAPLELPLVRLPKGLSFPDENGILSNRDKRAEAQTSKRDLLAQSRAAKKHNEANGKQGMVITASNGTAAHHEIRIDPEKVRAVAYKLSKADRVGLAWLDKAQTDAPTTCSILRLDVEEKRNSPTRQTTVIMGLYIGRKSLEKADGWPVWDLDSARNLELRGMA